MRPFDLQEVAGLFLAVWFGIMIAGIWLTLKNKDL